MALAGACVAPAHAADTPIVCALAETARTGAVISVPFETVDGRIYVTARVNGKGPFRFAVDTGASGLGRADARLVAALGLTVTGSGQSSDGVATAQVDTVSLASLELGGLARRDLSVITRDYNGRMSKEAAFDGIIGRDFFADGLLVIDYPNRRLTFTRTAGLRRDAPGVLGYARAFRVPVTIGSVTVEGQLDTGANVAFVLPQSLFERIGGGAVTASGEGSLTNTTIKTDRATVAGPFRIGAASLANVEVRVSDRFPELLVGAHALQNFALLIDQRTASVALCPTDRE
ncbi:MULTISPECIES: aspartyl protease family protein [unclassified Sphingomonas]|uniref:aspartyl protease family protein n=1 Tax=unclassified Sphingomonas TaxID=196159 RepID=UPI0021509592|nr:MULTISPECIES: aspartyl protease family protein [unclassified Sphingomonas]MCR5871064.1 aspartyl protease family protein [Sphingomonas sp. J344]UUY00618.1 aspartyl protease family protein [Sphingomonas sp. J315]